MRVLQSFLLLASASAFVSGPSAAHCRQTAPWTTTGPLFAEAVDEITGEAAERMSKSVDSVKLSLNTIRTGRASANMLDRIKVDYYGVETPVNQMATISVPSAQQLQIDPFDKSVSGDIEKAISESELGLTPNNDGNVIRINIPSLT